MTLVEWEGVLQGVTQHSVQASGQPDSYMMRSRVMLLHRTGCIAAPAATKEAANAIS
jgi:hypothetical protein